MEETVVDPATLLNMPYELQQKIALDLDIVSALNLCEGAKALKSKICDDDDFWQAKYQRDFEPRKIYESLSWFENYKMKANGVLNFEYDFDSWRLDVYLGTRKLNDVANFNPDSFYADFEEGLTPLEVLTFGEEGIMPEAGERIWLRKEGDHYELSTHCMDYSHRTYEIMTLILTRKEILRLFTAIYDAYQRLD